jgi:hypothetical protein
MGKWKGCVFPRGLESAKTAESAEKILLNSLRLRGSAVESPGG